MSQTITAAAVQAEVRRLAREYPDTVYNSGIRTPKITGSQDNVCFYTRGTTPSGRGCIFGQALRNLGVSEELLKDFDGDGLYPIGVTTVLLRDLGVRVTASEGAWFFKVQKLQDTAATWADAVKGADQHVASM